MKAAGRIVALCTLERRPAKASGLPETQEQGCLCAGKSPLLGSPWPYLMHKRKAHNPPPEHAGPTTVPEGTEQGDDAEAWLRPSPSPSMPGILPLPFPGIQASPIVFHWRAKVTHQPAEYLPGIFGSELRASHVHDEDATPISMQASCGAAQADKEDVLNPLASDATEPASMGHRRSGRLDERVSFVSGRGSWHPTSGPDTNGAVLPCSLSTPCFVEDGRKDLRKVLRHGFHPSRRVIHVRRILSALMSSGRVFAWLPKRPHDSVHGQQDCRQSHNRWWQGYVIAFDSHPYRRKGAGTSPLSWGNAVIL